MRRSGSLTYHIDAAEVLDAATDDDLLEEVRARHLDKDGVSFDYFEEVRVAWHELRCGRAHEAMAILDRIVNPKWPAKSLCQKQYDNERKAS